MVKEVIIVNCPYCKQQLEINEIIKDQITCPHCKQLFPQENVTLQVPRLENWYKNLLDFSTRNFLLNYSKRTLYLITSTDEKIFQELYKIIALNKIANIFEVKNNLIYCSNLQNINKNLDESNIKKIYKNYKTNLKEYSINTLYYTFGEITYIKKSTKKEYSAPLFLLPVSMSYNKQQNKYTCTLLNESLQINYTLIKYLSNNYGVNFDMEKFEINKNINNINNLMNEIKSYLKEISNLDIKINNNISICNFMFNNYMLAKELETNGINMLLSNSLCNQLGLHYNEQYTNDNNLNSNNLNQQNTYYLDNLDSYQLNAVKKSNQNESFVMFGPPGTGKSHTIFNSIINLIANGKKVLFIAEKKSALDVIKNKFHKFDLLYLDLHNNKLNTKKFYKDLKRHTNMYDNVFKKTSLNSLNKTFLKYEENELNPFKKNKEEVFSFYKNNEAVKAKILVNNIHELKNNNTNINFDKFNDYNMLYNDNNINKIQIIKDFINSFSIVKDYYLNYNWLKTTKWNLFTKNNCILQITNYKNLIEKLEKLKIDFQNKYNIVFSNELLNNKQLLNLQISLNENNMLLLKKYNLFDIKQYIKNFEISKKIFFTNFNQHINDKNIIKSDDELDQDFKNINKYININNNIRTINNKYNFIFSSNKINSYKSILQNFNNNVHTSINNYLDEKAKIKEFENNFNLKFDLNELNKNLNKLINDISLYKKCNFFKRFFKKFTLVKQYKNITKYSKLTINTLIDNYEKFSTYNDSLSNIKKYQQINNINLNELDDIFLKIILQYKNTEILNDIETLNKNYFILNSLEIKLKNYELLFFDSQTIEYLENQFQEYKKIKYLDNILITDIKQDELEITLNIMNELQNNFDNYKHIITNLSLLKDFQNDINNINNVQNEISNYKLDEYLNIINMSSNELDTILDQLSNKVPECENISKYNEQYNNLVNNDLLDIYNYLLKNNMLNNDGINICLYNKNMYELQKFTNLHNNYLDIENIKENINNFEINKKYIILKILEEIGKKYEELNYSFKQQINKQLTIKKDKQENISTFMKKHIQDILKIIPCILMSPLSVATYLPEIANLFDIIIFDESSQIYTYNAISALYRAKNAIVVGDDKQLTPTSFFQLNASEEETEEIDEKNINDEKGYKDNKDIQNLSNFSLLDEFKCQFPSISLQNHYRSKDESLITLNNKIMYENELKTFPNANYNNDYIKLCFVENGRYESNKNENEAKALIEYLLNRLKTEDIIQKNKTVGIITFNKKQQSYIQYLIDDYLLTNKQFSNFFDPENNYFWVKNLESVQGDEADIILFSICFGYNNAKKFIENFGPINKENGCNRLNVATSRAKEEEIIFTSIHSYDIKNNNNNNGSQYLKEFLQHAENYSQTKLNNLKNMPKNSLSKSLGNYIESLGYQCIYDYGNSDYHIDIAVKNKENTKFIAGFKLNTDNYNTSGNMTDFEFLYPNILTGMNWNINQINYLQLFHNEQLIQNNIKTILQNCE